ncbi:MAG TPA: hypothetical protein VM925_25180 [Labilithrix sp.]|nr:hypothetical protein [Labilithrix sp.]
MDAGDTRAVDAAAAHVIVEAPDGGSKTGVPDRRLVGEWERRTEPYKGMRVTFGDQELATRAIVTTAPPVTEERLASQARSAPRTVAKAQLECQRSLWKSGEEVLSGIHPAGDAAFEATIIVRDWGFAGTCRHADSRAPARLAISPDGQLSITVTRGKAITQQWARVGP